jgi:putative transferase (TIGR04331 family)
MKNDNLIITTCLKETWIESQNAFFTGEWCINYKDKIKYQSFEIISSYEQRDELYNDYLFLNKTYEKLINEFYKIFNDYHGTDYDKKFWEIFFGFWLRKFIEITYLHYKVIAKLENKGNLFQTVRIIFPENYFFTKNCFWSNRFYLIDTWRHYLQIKILENAKFKVNFINKNYEKNNELESFLKYKNNSYNNFLKKCYLKLFKKKIINSKFFIYKSYLGKLDEILLNIRLKNFPSLINKNYINYKKNFFDRKSLNVSFEDSNNFENLLKNIIKEFIPSTFLENFNEISNKVDQSILPSAPKVIFSSHLLNDELGSLYLAKKYFFHKTKLIYCQHGGVYGQTKFGSAESHEINLSDNI